MLCFKNNICGRKYILKLLLLMQNIVIVSAFLLFKAKLLSTGDGEGEWEPWEQIQGSGQRTGTAETHGDPPQKLSGANQR